MKWEEMLNDMAFQAHPLLLPLRSEWYGRAERLSSWEKTEKNPSFILGIFALHVEIRDQQLYQDSLSSRSALCPITCRKTQYYFSPFLIFLTHQMFTLTMWPSLKSLLLFQLLFFNSCIFTSVCNINLLSEYKQWNTEHIDGKKIKYN